MAQPQHTRNDKHSGLGCIWGVGACLGGHDSFYEKYITARTLQSGLFTLDEGFFSATEGSPNKVNGQGQLDYGSYANNKPTFNRFQDFFSTGTGADGNAAGLGLANYTNRGFYSFGTNIGSETGYPSPDQNGVGLTPVTVTGTQDQPITDLAGQPVIGSVTFLAGSVRDHLRGTPDTDIKLSTVGPWDQFLRRDGRSSYTLNYFNYNDQARLLIPRAVAYSAGLIDYFFRGKMEISLPDEGVYGIVDHAVENQKNTGGFRVIKLKLRNLTPRGNGVEPMSSDGKLVAVVKFHRNNCYEPELTGEYGSPGKDWNTCRATEEDIVVSNEIATPAGINTAAQPLTFTFPAPIPINATDVYLQVVYRGKLGDEENAVAVATKDISEPTFFASTQLDEQFLTAILGLPNSGYGYTWREGFCELTQPPVVYDPDCRYKYRVSRYFRFAPPPQFDPANPITSFNATFAHIDQPMSSYSRVAILGELNQPLQWYSLRQYEDGVVRGENGSTGANLMPELSGGAAILPIQFDPLTNQLLSPRYLAARGIFVPLYPNNGTDEYRQLNSGDTPRDRVPNLSPLAPRPSMINSQFLVQ